VPAAALEVSTAPGAAEPDAAVADEAARLRELWGGRTLEARLAAVLGERS
jgi:hypothetical protein